MGALDIYNHYKYHHFFSICFGLGCALLFYRPFYSTVLPSVLGLFFTAVFECVGATFDIVWGYGMAFFVAYLHLRSYHVYTLSCGGGLAVFALRGAIRKYNVLRKKRQRKRR